MKTNSMIFEIYPYNENTNTITIPIRLNRYSDLYNPIDPSPSPMRDLSQELLDYLEQCSSEISLEYIIDLAIEVKDDIADSKTELGCLTSIRNFFKHEIFVAQNDIHRMRISALKHFLISLTCLSVYVISGQFDLAGIPVDIIKEAILIGGWVFMWESVTHNFIQIEPLYEQIKHYKRIINASIKFSYPQR